MYSKRFFSYKKQITKKLNEGIHRINQNNSDFLITNSQRPKVVILMYHGVVKTDPSKFNYRHISIRDFEIQLKLLKQHCNVISIKDLFLKELPYDRLNVAITFDDGFKNNYINAIPLLEKFNFPASFYITGGQDFGFDWLWPDFLDVMSKHVSIPVNIKGKSFISNGKFFAEQNTKTLLRDIVKHINPTWEYKEAIYCAFNRWAPNMYRPDYRPYWELMNEEEIKLISNNSLFTIGCHGYFHNNLGSLEITDAIDELKVAKKYLERIIDFPVNELAYPDGSYSKILLKAAEEIGFEIQLGVSPLFGESKETKYPSFRFGIYSFSYPRTQLVEMLSESYYWSIN